MDSFEVQGLWWLPEHEEHRVPGVLSWEPDGGGSLKLVGQLRPVVLLDNHLPDGRGQKYRDHSRDEDRSYPVVLGEVEGRAYTLLHSFQASKRDWSLQQSTETVHVNAVLEGARFDGPELEVDRAAFRLRDLADWVGITGLKVTHPAVEGTGDEMTVITAAEVSDRAVPSSGPRVSLGHRLGVTPRGNEAVTVDQDWVLRIDQEQVAPVESLLEVASDFQDLVSIATGRTAEFRRVVLFHPVLPLRSVGGPPIGQARQELPFHAQWPNRVAYDAEGAGASRPLDSTEMYFGFADLTAAGLGRWLDTAAHFRTELGRVMSTRYGHGYLEDRIMHVCAALESLDKHHRHTDDNVNYVDRIKACVGLAGDEFRELLGTDPDTWAGHVKDLRHDLAHHRDRFRIDGSVGEHLVSEQLFWLFASCLLRVAEAPDVVFESIARHPQWRWLRMQAWESADS